MLESGKATATGASGADALSWDVLSYVCMNEVYLTLHTHRTVRSRLSNPPRVDLKVIKKAFATVGLGGIVQRQLSC